MQRRHWMQSTACAAIAAIGAPLPSLAQAFPSRPLRLVVPFPPGGPTDSFARLYAQGLGRQIGQTVVVDNKAGASGAIGSLEVKNSAADGYTALFATASTHALYGLIERQPRYDAAQDFDYVAVVGGAPVAFAASPAMPDTFKGLADAARAKPGAMNYGSPGTGTLLHVATEQLLQLTAAPITHVPYKGSGPAMQDLMGGNIQMAVGTLGGLLPLHRSGRLRLLGVATSQRLPLAPDIPTVAESAGLATPFEAVLWHVVALPRNSPSEVRQALAEATRRALEDEATVRSLASQGMFSDLRIGDAAASGYVKAEAARWKPIIDRLGDQVRR